MKKISKPTGNFPSFFEPYMKHVPDDGNISDHLANIVTATEMLVSDLSEEQLNYRYDKDKWTIKDILVHLSDCERIFIYRAMRIARGDKTDLPGFEEKLFAMNANACSRQLSDILHELKSFRASSLVFIETLTDEELDQTGTANGYPISTRLLVNHIYGHHQHHLKIIEERYL